MARWEPMLDAVMRERAGRLLAYAGLLTGDDAEAQDVLQDALVKTFSGRARFEHINAAEAYVRRTIATLVVDRARKRVPVPVADDAHPERPAQRVDSDAAVDVRAALAALPPRERACMVLRFYDDLTVPQISDRLGIAQGTVKRYLADASAAMASALAVDVDWHTEPDPAATVTAPRSVAQNKRS